MSQFFNKNMLCSSIFILTALTQVGCSGSGSDQLPSEVRTPDSSNPAVEEQQTTRIHGNVVKGLVKNAQVDFYQIEEGAPASTPFASVMTNEQGQFEINVENAQISDMVLVKATGQSNLTQMVCDASICGSTDIVSGIDENEDNQITLGEELYLSESFELSSVVSRFDSSESIEISITPITHLAVSRAIAEDDLSQNNIDHHMGLVSNLFDLPKTLAQLVAIDITQLTKLLESESITLEDGTIIYSVYSAMFAQYAHANNMTIEAAINDITQNIYHDRTSFNRPIVLRLLENALETAKRIAQNDAKLQQLIADIQMLILKFRCDEDLASEEECAVITPPQPPTPGENELEVVKDFVKDLRSWARDVTLQADPAIEQFTQRLDLMDDVWKNDFSHLTKTLNDLLPGIAQTISPHNTNCYYYYCSDRRPAPIDISPNHKRLIWNGVQYDLYEDGTMHIEGQLKDVEIDVDLQLPPLYMWEQHHVMEVTAGRLTHGGTDLVLTQGSQLEATYSYDRHFADLMNEVSLPYNETRPEKLTFNGNFFLQSKYSVLKDSRIDFEESDTINPITLSGDWQVTNDRAASGSYSLRSKRISHNQRSRTSAQINTVGGYLSFDYAVESESHYDYIRLYIDGRQVWSVSGYHPSFKRKSHYIAPGNHTVTWVYSKDGSVSNHQDAAWIDNIQFPLLVDNSALPADTKTKTILNGSLSLTAEKLSAPWIRSIRGYIPGDIAVSATFSNEFEALEGDAQTTYDQVSLNLTANIANAADFVPPQPFDINTLSRIGHYTVEASRFTLTMPYEITTIDELDWDDSYFLVQKFIPNENEPFETNYVSKRGRSLIQAAGQIIDNSAIGWHVIVPEEGLYISTLLGSSPWGYYHESRFEEEGGDVFGYLVDGFDPTETEAQYLELSAALNITADIDGLRTTTFGISINRHNLNEGELTFYIAFDGRRFNIHSNIWYSPVLYQQDESIEAVNPSLNITNQDGVTLDVWVDGTLGNEEVKDNIVGELVYNGTVYGTIERVKGLTIIRYIDGSGESLE